MAERRTEALAARGRFQSFLTEQPREGVCSRHVPATFGRKFTLIELPVVKTRQICHPSLTCTRQSREEFGGEKASFSVPNPHQTSNRPIIIPQHIPAPGSIREGVGGEKAAHKSASLPVPNNHQTPHRPVIAPQQSLRSASGEVEQKREWVFPQKSGKSRSRFCGSFSPCRPTAAESDSDPYAAPAPCRTQGVRGAADTPPATHDPATPEKQRKRARRLQNPALFRSAPVLFHAS